MTSIRKQKRKAMHIRKALKRAQRKFRQYPQYKGMEFPQEYVNVRKSDTELMLFALEQAMSDIMSQAFAEHNQE